MSYGCWITNEGVVHEVESMCGHTQICPYSDAHRRGWIATIDTDDADDKRYFYCVRFNPARTTPKAYKALISRLRRVSWDQFTISTMYMSNFVGKTNDDLCFTKFELIEYIKKLISGVETLSDGHEEWYQFDDEGDDDDGVDYYE